MKLEPLYESVIYRNPQPGHRAVAAVLPSLVSFNAGEVLCFYRVGQTFYSHDGRLALARSHDAGQTWTSEGLVWNAASDRLPYTYTAPDATRLRDGTLLLLASRYAATEETPERFNPATGGLRRAEAVLFRSRDLGRSWSAPEPLAIPEGDSPLDTPSCILELENGRWFLACESWKAWDDVEPLHIKGIGLFSEDQGRTWGEPVDFPTALDAVKMYSHSCYTRMQDGRIGALQWTQSVGAGQNYDLHLVFGDPQGRNWSLPSPTGIPGQTSALADLGHGRLAAVYTSRDTARPGIVVTVSVDHGKTWDLEHQVVVWDAVGQEYLGVTHKPSYPASHDNIAFGRPDLVRLEGGDLLCSWWCTQRCITHVRSVRLRVQY